MVHVSEPSTAKMKLDTIKKIFEDNTKHPEIFLSNQPKKANKFKTLTKNLYDTCAVLEDSVSNQNALPELCLDQMDDEQIWQQLELWNNSVIPKYLVKTSKMLSYKNGYLINNWYIRNTNEADSLENNKQSQDDIEKDFFEEGTDDSGISDANIKQKTKKKHKSSVVDDKFFKLSEMEEFLKHEDAKEEIKNRNHSTENDIDYFNSASSEGDEEEQNVKYSEFFDDEEDELSSESLEINKKKESKKRKYDEDDDSLQKEEEFSDDSEEPISNQEKSSYEQLNERLKEHIEGHEAAALSEKPWTLKGEIDATGRPQNSLLEKILEFDSTTRPAPLVTEETTLCLEEIIRRRIKDKAWDDVVRKHKPVQTPQELRKKLILNQEKSKESLAEIYEKEYRNQKELTGSLDTNDSEESKQHKEIKTLMKSLFVKLDALSNFHYTPKLVEPETRITTNTPAIEIEEVTPSMTSNAKLLAPEEVKSRIKGDLIGKGERTQADKNRERRKKKIKQRIQYKANENNTDSQKNDGKNKLLKAVTKHRNVDKLNTDGSTVKSSKAFFSQLQDKVSQQTLVTKKKRTTDPISAKRLKL